MKLVILASQSGTIERRLEVDESGKLVCSAKTNAKKPALVMPLIDIPSSTPPLPIPDISPHAYMFNEEFSPALDRNVPIPPKMRQKPFYGKEINPRVAQSCY